LTPRELQNIPSVVVLTFGEWPFIGSFIITKFFCCQNVVLVVDAEKLIPRGRKEGIKAVTLAVVENSPLG